jgi:hypothetical protein
MDSKGMRKSDQTVGFVDTGGHAAGMTAKLIAVQQGLAVRPRSYRALPV